MSTDSRRLAGILLVVLPTVMYGGVALPDFLVNDPAYRQNPLRQDLFRAGHAHAGAVLPAIGVPTPGIGLIRKPKP